MFLSFTRYSNNIVSRTLAKTLPKYRSNSFLSYGFCQEQKLNITIPVYNKSPLLYAKKGFSEGKNEKVPPLILYISPSLVLGIHETILNCWSTWSIVYSSCLFLFGYLIKRTSDNFLGRSVQAL